MAHLSGLLNFTTSATVLSFLLLAYYGIPTARQFFSRRKTALQHGCQPPPSVPSKVPILGLDIAKQMTKAYDENRRSEFSQEQHGIYGPTFSSTALRKTRIFTIDPENLRAIFSADFKDWGVQPLRLPAWEMMLGKGVMDTDGPYWRHSRDMVQPLFRKENISDLDSFDVHVSNFLKAIPKDGSTVDLQPLIAHLLLDFTTEFLFGESSWSLTSHPDEKAVEFLEAFHYGQAAMGRSLQLPVLSVFNKDKKFWEAARIAQDFADQRVDEAIRRKKSGSSDKKRKYILVDEFVKVTEDRMDIRCQLLNTFLAAHDTTATLTTNVLFYLARHPRVYEKLRREVLQLDPENPSHEEIKSLPYLKNIVTETSRLRGVVAQTARIALHDTILPTGGGPSGTSPIFVAKGTSAQLNAFSLHRRPEVFGQDADKFRPERWEGLQVGAWEFMPFISGPRVCPAQYMALMQVRYTVAKIAQNFKTLESRDPVYEFVEEYRVSSDSKNGCKVSLTPA